ncbi:hypothetical protein MKX03_033157, partial [Papaver bracteatum]
MKLNRSISIERDLLSIWHQDGESQGTSWTNFSECMSNCREPEYCAILREDYPECLVKV